MLYKSLEPVERIRAVNGRHLPLVILPMIKQTLKIIKIKTLSFCTKLLQMIAEVLLLIRKHEYFQELKAQEKGHRRSHANSQEKKKV